MGLVFKVFIIYPSFMTKMSNERKLDKFMRGLRKRNPAEPEFHQAVEEVAESIFPFLEAHPHYEEAQILERLTEPDRIIIFRVTWTDDKDRIRVNRGFRVQFNNAIGPYKGGLRFHPTVSRSILKFLGFEQTFKNSLTSLPMGGAKGGSNFNPKGKSDMEIMRFCQAFMTELSKYIGPEVDVPAGDIGVGEKEIGYLYGQFKRQRSDFTGSMTGKGLSFGGSLIRKEATGYGAVYFAQEMLKHNKESIEGKTASVSGAGNVAQHAIEKLIHLGSKVLTISDSGGFVYVPDGITIEQLEFIKDLKTTRRGSIREFAEKFHYEFHPDVPPWFVKADMAFPCATQNELTESASLALIQNGVKLISEGANMPCTKKAVDQFMKAKVLFGPGKAANAGGVAVSGLEQTQNAMRMSWSREEVDRALHRIMVDIHEKCVLHGQRGNWVNYKDGANIAGFIKVADAMMALGTF